jgi:hypothetical protein
MYKSTYVPLLQCKQTISPYIKTQGIESCPISTVRSESRCVFIKGIVSDVKERLNSPESV